MSSHRQWSGGGPCGLWSSVVPAHVGGKGLEAGRQRPGGEGVRPIGGRWLALCVPESAGEGDPSLGVTEGVGEAVRGKWSRRGLGRLGCGARP